MYVGTTGSGYTKGHWYYWNDTQWADGGVYQSDGVVTVDDTLLSPGVPADAKAAGALILVSDTQPIDSTNKIWFPETDPEVTQVPTWTEHQAVVADVVELQEMISDVPIYGMSVIKDLVSTSITLSATTETRYIYGELSSLTITSLPSQGFVNIFFRSGSTPTVLTLPQTVIMPSWFVVGSNETIMISIADGVYGSAQTWES